MTGKEKIIKNLPCNMMKNSFLYDKIIKILIDDCCPSDFGLEEFYIGCEGDNEIICNKCWERALNKDYDVETQEANDDNCGDFSLRQELDKLNERVHKLENPSIEDFANNVNKVLIKTFKDIYK